MSLLPNREVPEHTSGMEGFFHIHKIKGDIENAGLELIVRDHDAIQFEARKSLLRDIVAKLNQRHGPCAELKIEDPYRNMREKVEPGYHIVEIAEEAMQALRIEPPLKPTRGAADRA